MQRGTEIQFGTHNTGFGDCLDGRGDIKGSDS